MEIIVELTTWQGETVKVSARKSPSDSYKPDESDPTVTEFVVELDDYSEKDIAMMSGGINLHNWHEKNKAKLYCSNTPRKWSK